MIYSKSSIQNFLFVYIDVQYTIVSDTGVFTSNLICIECAVPEIIHTLPMEGQWKFQGGRGSHKPEF